ncbi:hypothetical protein OV079_53135 [Nannocystis pusilla]|uniref:Uncharacterized protein n=1 Tax=Nannocystis pusilla TaxID=889268 RepID=A0A9X3F9Z3_9BACT|nr:hypothetical protein [Nannocystis pusilla]MCY1014121.1 hypothetical protein [Nannocystis pusilla]
MAREIMGHSPAGLFGYSHMMGGFWGGQAEYLRVPFADVGPLKIESELTDEQVLFLSDIFPTGYFTADLCGIEPGDTVAVGLRAGRADDDPQRLDAGGGPGGGDRPRPRAPAHGRGRQGRSHQFRGDAGLVIN